MNFSQITDDLFIGTMPEVQDYARLRELGVRLVINMRFARGPQPDPHPEALKFLWLRTIDSPFILSPTKKLIHGTRTSLETILQGGKVYSHCAVGRHRSVAMGAAILIAQGHTPETAIKLIKNQRPVADPDVFYVRHWITVFAKHWRNMKAA